MPAIIPAIASELANGARDVLRQGAAVVTGNQGEYIANGQPESIYGKIQQATARQACRRYADDPGKFTGAAAVLVENACRPYLNDIGYGQGPRIELPARGGQCQDNYNINGSVQVLSGACNATTQTINILGQPGPLSGPFYDNGGSVGNAPPTCPNTRGTRYFLRNRNGTVITLGGSGGGVRNGSVTFTRVGGVPDNCGNQPPEITPPVPPTTPGPKREPYNPSPDVNIDIDVEINPGGTINVDFGTGPITIDPFGESGGGGSGGGPGGVGSPGSPEDTGTGGGADGEAPEGQILTGLRIDFVEPPIGGNEYAPGVYRGVCYIYMGTTDGLDHDPAGAMLRSGQFVYAEKDFLTRWAVSANAGYNLRVTPYYRPADAEG